MILRSLVLRRLQDWSENEPEENFEYIIFCIFLVLFAGCMSGLTLGLLSMDIVDLEVLIRSGTPLEQERAKKVVPIVKNAHYLLVTLLLCNAAAMETLPLFLDNMVHESVAIIISVTAVLLFGEIIPQAICSKHGLMIGAYMAYPVRFLMILTGPISWPLSKVLDRVLGGDHASLFRRKQLKALVHIHAKDEGFGGKLTPDEIGIITGAMDLTTKTAYTAMTPIEKVFMLSNMAKLDDSTVEAIMSSKPFSRVPVYRGENKKDIVGLILVKELLEYVKKYPDSPVSSLKIRPLPRLSASTPMYDMLRLFRTGRSHMALLTQPLLDEAGSRPAATAATFGSTSVLAPHANGGNAAGPDAGHAPSSHGSGEQQVLLGTSVLQSHQQQPQQHQHRHQPHCSTERRGRKDRKEQGHHERHGQGGGANAAAATDASRWFAERQLPVTGASWTDFQEASPEAEGTGGGTPPHVLPVGGTPLHAAKCTRSASLEPPAAAPMVGGSAAAAQSPVRASPAQSAPGTAAQQSSLQVQARPTGGGAGAPHAPSRATMRHSASGGGTAGGSAVMTSAFASGPGPSPSPRVGSSLDGGGGPLSSSLDMELGFTRWSSPYPAPIPAGAAGNEHAGGAPVHDVALEDSSALQLHGATSVVSKASRVSRSRSAMNSIKRFFRSSKGLEVGEGSSSHLDGRSSRRNRGSLSSSSTTVASSDDDVDDMVPIPQHALPGEPIGILTIEDVIEELMQFEIVDETDKFVDNNQSVLVVHSNLEQDLPDNLRAVLAMASMQQQAQQQEQARQQHQQQQLVQHSSRLASIVASMLRSGHQAGETLFRKSPSLNLAAGAELAPLLEEKLDGTSGPVPMMARSATIAGAGAPAAAAAASVAVVAAGAAASAAEAPSGALAAALLVAAGKRAPVASTPVDSLRRVSVGGVSAGVPQRPGLKSQELFSYLALPAQPQPPPPPFQPVAQ